MYPECTWAKEENGPKELQNSGQSTVITLGLKGTVYEGPGNCSQLPDPLHSFIWRLSLQVTLSFDYLENLIAASSKFQWKRRVTTESKKATGRTKI